MIKKLSKKTKKSVVIFTNKLFIFFPLFMACTTVKFEPDTSLLRPWSDKLYSEQGTNDSFVALFRKGDKELVYIAGKHAKSSEDKVFQIIETQMRIFKPQTIILEGFSPSMPEARMREMAQKCAPDFVKCGEKYQAIHLAYKSTKLISGEPSEKDIVKGAFAKGYSSSDILYFYLVRQIPQMRRQGELKKSQFNKKAEKLLKRWSKIIQISNFDFRAKSSKIRCLLPFLCRS